MWNIVLIGTVLVTLQLSVNGDVSHLVGQDHHHHHHEHHNHPGYDNHKPSNPLEFPDASTETHGTSHPGYPKEKPKNPFNIKTSGSGNIGTQYIPPISDSTGASTGGIQVQTQSHHHEHHYHGEDGKYNPHDDGRGWDIRKSVPGEPEVDYPTLASVPRTSFTCREKIPGYYADIESRCQVFRICTTRSSNAFTSFLCPNGTLFNQNQLTCDWWNNVDCEHSDQYYYKNNEIGKMPEGPQLMYEINKMLQAPFQFSQKNQQQYHKYESDNQIQGTAENQQGVYLPPKLTTQSTYHHQESSTAGYKYTKPKPTPNQLKLQKEYHQQQQYQQHHQEQHQYHQEQHQHVSQQPQYVTQQVIQTSIPSKPEQSSDSSSSSSINLPVAPVYGALNQVGAQKQGKQTISTSLLEPPRLPDKHESHITTSVPSTTIYSSNTLPSSTTVTYSTTTPYSTTVLYSTTTPYSTSSTTTTAPSSTTISSSTTPKLHLSQISKPNPQPLFVSEEKTKASSQSSQENQLFTSPAVSKDKQSGDGMLFTSPFISRKTQTKDAQPLFVSPEKQGMLFTSPLITKNNTLFTSAIKTPKAPKAPEVDQNKVQFLSPQINQKPDNIQLTFGNTQTTGNSIQLPIVNEQPSVGPQKVSLLNEGSSGISLPVARPTIQSTAIPVTTSTQVVTVPITTQQTLIQHQQQQPQPQQVLNIQGQFDKHNPFNQADIAAVNQVFSHSGVQQTTGVQQEYGVPQISTQTSNAGPTTIPELTKDQAIDQIKKLQNDLGAFYNQNKQTVNTEISKKNHGEGVIDIREKNNNPLTIPTNTFGVNIGNGAIGKSIQFGTFPTSTFQDRSDFGVQQSLNSFAQGNPFQTQKQFNGFNQQSNVKFEFSKDGYLDNYNGQGLSFHGNGGQTYSNINGQNTAYKETTKVEIIPAISFEITDHSGANFQSFLGQGYPTQNSYSTGQQYHHPSVGQFNSNVGQYSSNVGQYSSNVGKYSSNVGQYSSNVGQYNSNNGQTGGQQYIPSDARYSTYHGPSSYLVPQKSVLQLPSDSGYHR